MARKPGRNHVRARREARGLSQAELAERAGLSRQSIGAIEAGRATPAVDVALRIAAALDDQVEVLFGATTEPLLVAAEPGASSVNGRVALAHIGGRWVCHPLVEDAVLMTADGVVTGAERRKVRVEPVRALAEARDNVVVMGCALGLGLLSDRLNSRPGPGRFLWWSRSSTAALGALDRGHAHVAGVHLVEPRTGAVNVPFVRRMVKGEPVVLVTLARWEAGLVLRPGDAKRIRGVADLVRPGLRLAAREQGSGAQSLLERELRASGLPLGVARDAPLRLAGHLDVARAVASGAADAGVATRDAALSFGLGFVTLAEERYDLVLPRAGLEDPRLSRLLDVLVSADFRRELTTLGYDARPAGDRVAEVRS